MFDNPARLLAALSAGVLVVGTLMALAGRGMTRSGGPGIVAYQLAEDVGEVQRIFTRWGEVGRRAARASLQIDYAWLVLYSALLFVAASALAAAADRAAIDWLATAGRLVAAAAVLAGVLDAVENTVLLRQLDRRPTASSVRVARSAAQVKFGLISIAALYIFYAFGRVQLAG